MATVTVAGVQYDVRPLTLAETRKISKMDEDTADYAAVSWSTGCDVAVVEQYFGLVSAGTAQAVIRAVMTASALDEAAQFQSDQADGVGPARAAIGDTSV